MGTSRHTALATSAVLGFSMVIGVLLDAGRVSASTTTAQPPTLHENFALNGPVSFSTGYGGAVTAIAIAPHLRDDPTDEHIVYVGTENGGVWKTTNFSPHDAVTWQPLTDHMPSNAITSLAISPTDRNTLVAGVGHRWTETGLNGGPAPLIGVMRTEDAGANWDVIPGLEGKEVLGVATKGDTVVAAVYDHVSVAGIYLSVLGGPFNPMMFQGPVTSLATDANDPNVLWAAVTGANAGFYRSDDFGLNWTKNAGFGTDVQRAVIETQAFDDGPTVVTAGLLTTSTAHPGMEISGIAREPNARGGWTTYLPPPANVAGVPRVNAVTDPTDASLLYVSGDEGPVFRCTVPDGDGGLSCVSTFGASRPHSDSWTLKFFNSDVLLYGNDGGLWERTDPRSDDGVWGTKNGNIAATQPNTCDYDNYRDVTICGFLDNNVQAPPTPGAAWEQLAGGDGQYVSVFDGPAKCFTFDTSPGHCSIRYYSGQVLQDFTRDACDQTGVCGQLHPTLLLPDGTSLATSDPGELTTDELLEGNPLTVDRWSPDRILIGTKQHVYESNDDGYAVRPLTVDTGAVSPAAGVVYGGRLAGKNDPDLVYVARNDGVYVRCGRIAGCPTGKRGSFGGEIFATGYDRSKYGPPSAITVDPSNEKRAWVATSDGRVWQTTNLGTTWQKLTGDLGPLLPSVASGAHELRSVAFIPNAFNPILLVGASDGVYFTDSLANGFTHWWKLRGELPNVPVPDLKYDAKADLLLIASHGRSTWLIRNASHMNLPPLIDSSLSDSSGDFNDAVTFRASLTDANTLQPMANQPIHFDVGGQSCDGLTNVFGFAQCSVVLSIPAGSYTLTARFNGAGSLAPVYDTRAFTVHKEEASLVYTGPVSGNAGSSVSVTATLFDPVGGVGIDGKAVTFRVGSARLNDSCTATTDRIGRATCDLLLTQPPGAYTLRVSYGGGTDFVAASVTTVFLILST